MTGTKNEALELANEIAVAAVDGTLQDGAEDSRNMVPMTANQIEEVWQSRLDGSGLFYMIQFARDIEAHHGITEVKP